MPYSSAHSVTCPSCTLPPGWAIYDTPTFDAWSIESLNGKNASLLIVTPVALAMNSSFSADESGSGTSLNCASHLFLSSSVKSPSMYRTRALTLSCLLTPSLNFRPRTLGCCLRYQVETFRPASFTQSTRLCCPAPTPTIIPSRANPTEFDWVYLTQMLATIMSRMAPSVSASTPPFVTTFFVMCSFVMTTSLRFWLNVMPYTSRYSTASGLKSALASSMMNFPPFFFLSISSAAGVYPGATMPSLTSFLRMSAVSSSTTSDTAAKSPKEHIGSAFRARR
mmetsp:Transcript_20241/g.44908  ORF Transcript_20241/g.44908 Transcript_20241/m.44908 type:complete len:280 (-) Transcript_20241:1051-1890(-)